MSENDEFDAAMAANQEPQPEQTSQPTPEDVFTELANEMQSQVPADAVITFRVESGFPIYVPLNEGEAGLTIRDAISRRNLTVSPATQAFVEGQPVAFETFVPAGSVVTLIGQVKGGAW